MSIRVMTQVWAASKLGGSELLCLLAIADWANDSGEAYPSVASLAQKIRMSKRNVNYILKKLEASGELKIHLNKGPKGCNLFVVQSLQPCKDCSLQPEVMGDAAGFSKGVQPVAAEPSVNRQEPSYRSAPKAKRHSKTVLPIGFAISQRVRDWAQEKGFDHLDKHLENFVSAARAKGYQYVDWDEAFMGAVRNDWARLRSAGKENNKGAWWLTDAGTTAKGVEYGLSPRPGEHMNEFKARVQDAINGKHSQPKAGVGPIITTIHPQKLNASGDLRFQRSEALKDALRPRDKS